MIKRALDRGITHFDVAPSYGYGEAEACLGNALQNNRQRVVIATKVGILSKNQSGFIKKLRPLAQKTVSIFPKMRSFAAKSAAFAGATSVSGQFSIEKINSSVEKSLLELKTDYIDILFLHDCIRENLSCELINHLEFLKKSGKIRIYGLATAIEVINHAHKNCGYTNFLPQFANNVLLKNNDVLQIKNSIYITHSTFSCLDCVKKWIANNQESLRKYGLWTLQADELCELMLGYVALKNENGIVICSMLDEVHLEKNIATFEKPRFTNDQILAFANIIDKRPNEMRQSISL